MTKPKIQTVDFDSLQLPIGARLQVALTRDIKPSQEFSTLIGYSRHEYVILKVPAGDGRSQIRESDVLAVRAFCGVNVCSFSTAVLRTFGPPIGYVHVAYPVTVQITELRSAMRVRTELAARLTEDAADSGGDRVLTIKNLSSSGALVESSSMLGNEGDTIQLVMDLPDHHSGEKVTLRIDSEIRKWHQGNGNSSAWLYGVRFTALDRGAYLVLQNYVYATLISNRLSII